MSELALDSADAKVLDEVSGSAWAAYPEYKDSGVNWLGAVPAHWGVKRLKYQVSKIGSGKTPRGGAEVYVSEGIMLIRSQNVYDNGLRLDDVVFIDEDADAEMFSTRVSGGDVLLNITGASIGRAAIVPDSIPPSNVNQHVCIIRPLQRKLLSKYLHGVLCSKPTKEQILADENGTSREGLNFRQVGNLYLCDPPPNEQAAIASFLNRETARIDALIAKKQRLIELLQEKRTALIIQAVTKGLDPGVPMKDSGVEWLGEIPAHWELVQFVHFIDFQEGPGIMASDFFDDGIPLLRIRNLQPGSVDLAGCNFLDEEKVGRQWSHFRLKEKDLLISGSASTGLVSEVDQYSAGSIAYTGIIRLRPRREVILRDFIKVLVGSELFFSQISLLKTGTTIQHFGPAHLRRMKITLPPIEEQEKIVDHVEKTCTSIDRLMSKIDLAIEKLKEYRTGLISAAVTGKIDVRNRRIM